MNDISVREIIETINRMPSDSFNACCIAVSEWMTETIEFELDFESRFEGLTQSLPEDEFDEDAIYDKHYAESDFFSENLRQTLLDEHGITEEQFFLLQAAGDREADNPGCIWPYVTHKKNHSLLRLL